MGNYRIQSFGGVLAALGLFSAIITYTATLYVQSVQDIVLPLVNLTEVEWRSQGLAISAGVGIAVFLVAVALTVIAYVVYQTTNGESFSLPNSRRSARRRRSHSRRRWR